MLAARPRRNLSRFLMNGVSRPCASRSSTTWLSGNGFGQAARRRRGPDRHLDDDRGLRLERRAGHFAGDRVGAGLQHRAVVGGRRPDHANVRALGVVAVASAANRRRGRRGSMPTIVSTVTSGTFDSRDASGDSCGMAAVEISGGGAPRPRRGLTAGERVAADRGDLAARPARCDRCGRRAAARGASARRRPASGRGRDGWRRGRLAARSARRSRRRWSPGPALAPSR